MDDRAAVARQLGREPRAFKRVVVRCPWGLPAVTEQEPRDETGAPFPTTYWLTCRHLVTAVARDEAAGGAERRAPSAGSDPRPPASLRGGAEGQRPASHGHSLASAG